MTGLRKSFDQKVVVNGVDLHVKKGEVFGFLGPNGSGKTTTIRMLCGLLTPDAGSGTCLGFNILTQSRQIKEHIGFMFPFWGMPDWAQWIGNMLPLTHFLIIVRGILLKGNGFFDVWRQVIPILVFTLVLMGIGFKRFRQTLD